MYSWKPQWGLLRKIHFQRCSDGHPFQQLSLRDIGMSIDDFSALRLSFNNLPMDTHHQRHCNTSLCTRFRRHQRFELDTSARNGFGVVASDDHLFEQKVADFRKQPRMFSGMEQHVVEGDAFLSLLSQLSSLVLLPRPNIDKLQVDVHQVRLLSMSGNAADNAPEGVHQDGADYIVSALVLNRHNVTNDMSVVYDKDQQELYRTTLQEGEFMFQDDKHLWHDIKPIRATENPVGYRDILGFDFTIT